MSESALTRRVIEKINGLPRSYCIKVHGNRYQKKGTPDVIGCCNTRSFVYEVKLHGNVPTAIQQYELNKWESAGSLIIPYTYNIDEAIDILLNTCY